MRFKLKCSVVRYYHFCCTQDELVSSEIGLVKTRSQKPVLQALISASFLDFRFLFLKKIFFCGGMWDFISLSRDQT